MQRIGNSALAFLQELARIPDDEPWTPADALAWWEKMGPRVQPVAQPAHPRDEVLTLDVEAATRGVGA